MSFAALKRYIRPSSRTIAYVLAALLPAASALTTVHIPALHSIPLALSFISVAFIATFAGMGPALVAVVVAIAARDILSPLPLRSDLSATEALRALTLTTSAVVISLMTRSRRRTSEALEVALATLREQTAALVQSQQASKCASWTYDSRDRTRWYPGGYEVFGISFTELEKLASPIDLIFPEDQSGVREAVVHMVDTRGPLHIEYRILWPDGSVHWSEARGTPLEGNPFVWRGVTFDITDRKHAQAALIRSEKLAAMGRLASTVAHEINNPLEAVTNLLYLARRDPLLTSSLDAYLATAERELARVGEITRLTLGFIRTSAERRDLDIVDGIEDVLSIFRHRFEMKEIRVDRQYQPGVTVNIAPQELRQIATNLISNAVDAVSGPNGRVNIQVERQNRTAVLLIEDNGSGIAEPHLTRIFDPFFSTKDDTGTGIGLWVTRELVEKNSGSISARSGDLPGGFRTSFRIEFPAVSVVS